MSVAQLETELPGWNISELDALEIALRREKGCRTGRTLSGEETRLFSVINEPLPGGNELLVLRQKRDERTLSDDEHARLLALENECEVAWAHKLRAVSELADLRGEDFQALYGRLNLTLRSN